MTATTPPETAPAVAPPVDQPAAEAGKRVGITAGRLRAALVKVQHADTRLNDAAIMVHEMLVGREGKSSEKVDALRALGSQIAQLAAPVQRILDETTDLIELVLDDD